MFCPECGGDNKLGNGLCEFCSTELLDNQPPETKISITYLRETFKKLNSISKNICIAVAVFILSGTVFGIVGNALTHPDNIASRYFNAAAKRDYKKMYGFYDIERSDFVNANSFTAIMKNSEDKAGKISNVKLIDKPSSLRETMTYRYDYSEDGKSKTSSVSLYTEGKSLLFFDRYVVRCPMPVVEDYMITVPKGANVSLNGISLKKSMLSTSGDGKWDVERLDRYLIPQLFAGDYNIRIEHALIAPYEGTMFAGDSSGYFRPEFELNEAAAAGIYLQAENTYKFLVQGAFNGIPLYDTGLDLSADVDALREMERIYQMFSSAFAAEDGAGLSSFAFESFMLTNQPVMMYDNKTCVVDMFVDYTFSEILNENGTLVEYERNTPVRKQISLAFEYDASGKWVLCGMPAIYLDFD